MKIIALGEKEVISWARKITVEYKGKKYSGKASYSDVEGINVYLSGGYEVNEALSDLIQEEYESICKDEVIKKK